MLFWPKAIKQKKLIVRNVEKVCAFNVQQLGIRIKLANKRRLSFIKDR